MTYVTHGPPPQCFNPRVASKPMHTRKSSSAQRRLRKRAGSYAITWLIAGALAAAPAAQGATAPLFDGLASDAVPKASNSALAQRYFAQGMVLTWGFNPAEAARSFEAATKADTRCALCYWGLAWSLGPNINTDMSRDAAPRVRDALTQARALVPRGSRRDRGLIDALSARHLATGDPPAIDEDAYAVRMRALALEYRDDANIAMLAAEALMNLHPYDWWDRDGKPRPWTDEIR